VTGGRVAGKVVVVTGAARGQGAAEARALAAEGATVVATDVADAASGKLDGAIVYRQLDVADPDGWAALAAELRERYGQVHGLVNNAGLTHRARLLDVELADWERMFRVNTTGPLLGIQALAPLMLPGASIVTIGSAAAVTPRTTRSPTRHRSGPCAGWQRWPASSSGRSASGRTWSTPATSRRRWWPMHPPPSGRRSSTPTRWGRSARPATSRT
jgi:NAD(P)-dependent dehydrogenase (short-subunit alcohol dehydrogenase family)